MKQDLKNGIYEEFDITSKVGDKILSDNLTNNFMSEFLKVNLRDVASAFVSSVISAVLIYIANLTTITDFNWEVVLGIAITVGATSLLKAFGTTPEGDFGGIVKIK